MFTKSRIASIAFASLAILNIPVHASQAHQECLDQADKDIERSLCELKKVSRNPALPSMSEFKKNPPNIQRLLLKREAERYGIALPKEIEASTQTKVSSKNQSKRKGNKTGIGNDQHKSRPSLSGCSLHQDNIACNKERYELVRNKKNNQLKAEAFSSYNELKFKSKSETEFKDQSDYRYLNAIYPIYIYKMLDIGLGDSTMSFTKFATVYWQSKKEDSGFSERFQKVYNQLKIEKSRNQVRSRYSDSYPENIDACTRMDSKIIICDNMHQNWVYKLK